MNKTIGALLPILLLAAPAAPLAPGQPAQTSDGCAMAGSVVTCSFSCMAGAGLALAMHSSTPDSTVAAFYGCGGQNLGCMGSKSSCAGVGGLTNSSGSADCEGRAEDPALLTFLVCASVGGTPVPSGHPGLCGHAGPPLPGCEDSDDMDRIADLCVASNPLLTQLAPEDLALLFPDRLRDRQILNMLSVRASPLAGVGLAVAYEAPAASDLAPALPRCDLLVFDGTGGSGDAVALLSSVVEEAT